MSLTWIISHCQELIKRVILFGQSDDVCSWHGYAAHWIVVSGIWDKVKIWHIIQWIQSCLVYLPMLFGLFCPLQTLQAHLLDRPGKVHPEPVHLSMADLLLFLKMSVWWLCLSVCLFCLVLCRLSKHIFWIGLANFILSPFIFLWQILYSFLQCLFHDHVCLFVCFVLSSADSLSSSSG